jgi:polygalacturonase
MSFKLLSIIVLITFSLCCCRETTQDHKSSNSGQISGESCYSILDYGAVSSETIFSTSAIQKAIDDCNSNGGGKVIIPAGRYLTATLQLKSNVNLFLSTGATLVASKEIKDYPVLPGVKHGFNSDFSVQSLIYCINTENVSISGKGEIQLNGAAFVNKSASPEFDFDPDSLQRSQGTIVMGKRPSHSLFFEGCTNLSLTDFKITDSPAFTVSVSDCSIIEIRNIFIDNNMRLPNNDGIHLSGCKNAVVTDCKVFAGDDCVALTCLANYEKTSENIVITNSVFSSFSAGVRIGYLKSKIKNVILSNLIINESNRGIVLATGSGGYVKNVNIQNCVINTQIKVGRWWGNGEPIAVFIDDKADESGRYLNQSANAPIIEDITFSNIQAISENGVHVIGNKGNISRVFFSDCNFTIVDSHNRNVAGSFYDVQPGGIIKRDKGTIASFYVSGVKNLYFNNVLVIKKLNVQKDFNIKEKFVDCIVKKKEIEYLE